MLHQLHLLGSSLRAGALQRALLLVNHCLAAEPAATARLMPHAGRSLRVTWRPATGPWPVPPEVSLRVTPAGLFELMAEPPTPSEAVADLRVDVEWPAPHRMALQWLADERPHVAIDGDARFAADIAWLVEHLRWDVEHDLARAIGDVPAHQLARLGGALRDALRRTWDRRPARA